MPVYRHMYNMRNRSYVMCGVRTMTVRVEYMISFYMYMRKPYTCLYVFVSYACIWCFISLDTYIHIIYTCIILYNIIHAYIYLFPFDIHWFTLSFTRLMSFSRSVSCGVPVALSILRSEANDDLVQARDRPFYGDRMPYHQPFGTKCASNSAESISHHLTLNSLNSLTCFLIILKYETYRLCCHMLPLNCIEDFIELVRRGWTWFSYQLPAVHGPSKPFHIFSLGVQLSRFPKALVHILCWSMLIYVDLCWSMLIYILLGGGCHFFPFSPDMMVSHRLRCFSAPLWRISQGLNWHNLNVSHQWDGHGPNSSQACPSRFWGMWSNIIFRYKIWRCQSYQRCHVMRRRLQLQWREINLSPMEQSTTSLFSAVRNSAMYTMYDDARHCINHQNCIGLRCYVCYVQCQWLSALVNPADISGLEGHKHRQSMEPSVQHLSLSYFVTFMALICLSNYIPNQHWQGLFQTPSAVHLVWIPNMFVCTCFAS